LDEHTASSVRVGDDEFGRPQFDTKRSELGELLYRLKFQGDASVLEMIIETASAFVKSLGLAIDVVVPVPPSNPDRTVLPSLAVAQGVGERLGIPVYLDCITKTKRTPELKNVFDRARRLELLKDAYHAREADVAAKSVLLVDDLYRSGATLGAVTNALYETGKAREVYVIALTRARRLR